MDNCALKLTYVNNPLVLTLDSAMKLFLGVSRLRKIGGVFTTICCGFNPHRNGYENLNNLVV